MNNNMYDLSFFKELLTQGFNYTLPKKTIDIINKLSSQVGAPTYKKTPIFKKKLNRKNNNKQIKDEQWKNIRNFETTKVEKNDVGINRDINIFRVLLNKLTNDNYKDIENTIMEKIETLVDNITNEELKKINDSIFEIASSNSFYSQLYSNIYKSIMNNHLIFRDYFSNNICDIFKYIETFEDIDIHNYDDLCKFNSNNEKKKSLCKFLLNLSGHYIEIPLRDIIIDFVLKLINIFNKNIHLQNKEYICDIIPDLIENLLCESYLDDEDNNEKINNIIKELNKISVLKPKNFKSLTNKSIFKIMDIIDIFE